MLGSDFGGGVPGHTVTDAVCFNQCTVNASLISPREILIYALREEAGGIMLLHNHPSGDPTPSKQDIIMTRRIKEVSDLIDIPLIDHIVIGDKRYTSFKQKGLL